MGNKDKQSSNYDPSLYKEFYNKTSQQRIDVLTSQHNLNSKDLMNLASKDPGFSTENNIGFFSLPLGVAPGFLINSRYYDVPMVTEEPSVIAGACFGARLIASNGGFKASYSGSIMQAQIQIILDNFKDYSYLQNLLIKNKADLIQRLNNLRPSLVQRGGGLLDITSYPLLEVSSLIVLLDIDVCEAFGANIVDSLAEALGSILEKEFNLKVGLKILTNLCTKRLTKASCCIKYQNLDHKGFSGQNLASSIAQACRFSYYDQKRATTHNKGVLNGIDAVVLATGNDTRAVEAALHSYAVQNGFYRPLTTWSNDDTTKTLSGKICVPISVGVVGGITTKHPCVQSVMKILSNPDVSTLSMIIACVGLASNLAALRALVSEGIQKSHMRLHKKALSIT